MFESASLNRSSCVANSPFHQPAAAVISRRGALLTAAGILSACSSTRVISVPASNRALQVDKFFRTAIVSEAHSLQGVPYRWAGTSPTQGFDCSGLMVYVFKQVCGIRLPHQAVQLAQLGQKISINQIQQGDWVFFNTTGQPWSHMGLYIGAGQFIHAPSTGARVRVDSLSLRYYQTRLHQISTIFT